MNGMKDKDGIRGRGDAEQAKAGTAFRNRQTLTENSRRFEIEVKLRRSAPQSEEEAADAVLLSRFRQLKTTGGDEGKEQSDAMNSLEGLLGDIAHRTRHSAEEVFLLQPEWQVFEPWNLQGEKEKAVCAKKLVAALANLLDPDEPELLSFRLQLEAIGNEPSDRQIDLMNPLTIIGSEKFIELGIRPVEFKRLVWWPTEGRILAIERNIPKIEEAISPILPSPSTVEAVSMLSGKNMRHVDVGSELANHIERVKRAHGGFLDTVDALAEWEVNDPVKQWERGHPELAQKLAEKISIGES